MRKKFFVLEKSIQFYGEIQKIKFPYHLKNQILRAGSSISLNLAEGSAKVSYKEQARFYKIAHGSAKECQAILRLQGLHESDIFHDADFLGWTIWRLIKSREG